MLRDKGAREARGTVSERQPSNRQRFLTGLIGAPIAHSASPAMHEQAADALGVRCHYHLIEVAGADREGLRGLLDGVRRLGFAGVNMTFPYKEAVVELLDEMSPGAAAVGAVNAVVVRDNRLIGHNTDTTGFTRAAKGLVMDSPGDRRHRWNRRCRQSHCGGLGGPWGARNQNFRYRPGQGRPPRGTSADKWKSHRR